jgi:hypothetical protein
MQRDTRDRRGGKTLARAQVCDRAITVPKGGRGKRPSQQADIALSVPLVAERSDGIIAMPTMAMKPEDADDAISVSGRLQGLSPHRTRCTFEHSPRNTDVLRFPQGVPDAWFRSNYVRH